MNGYGGNITGTLLVTLVVLVVAFLVFREIFCWYWKINQSIALLTEVRDLLAGKGAGAAASTASGGPGSPVITADKAADAKPGASAVQPTAGIGLAARSLAERVRDNPRVPVDEKIELLQRLGGKFTWDRGSTCKVLYKGQEHTFPGGKEFGDWTPPVKSLTHSWLGRWALNARLTRSSGHGALASAIVVRTLLPRITPRRPCRRISRSTVQRATANFSRLSCRQTLSAP